MTALQAFEKACGFRRPLTPKFLEICDRLDLACLEFWQNPDVHLRQHMVDLAYKGMEIYEALPLLPKDYEI